MGLRGIFGPLSNVLSTCVLFFIVLPVSQINIYYVHVLGLLVCFLHNLLSLIFSPWGFVRNVLEHQLQNLVTEPVVSLPP